MINFSQNKQINELVFILAWSLLLLGVIVWNEYIWADPVSATLRVFFSIPFVLFFPGQAIHQVLFPRRGQVSLFEHILVSSGISLAIIPILTLMLELTLGLTLAGIIASELIIIVLIKLISIYQNFLNPSNGYSYLFDYFTRNNISYAFGSAFTFAIVVVLIATINTPELKATEFYILNPHHKANSYRNFQQDSNNDIEIVVGVISRETSAQSYRLVISDSDYEDTLESINIPTLLDGQQWEYSVLISPDKHYQRIVFDLYLQDVDDAPYRSLSLTISDN